MKIIIGITKINSNNSHQKKHIPMKKVYISGKISDEPMDVVFAQFKKSEDIVAKWHWETQRMIDVISVNPTNIRPLFGIERWLFFMVTDLIALKKCDSIYFIDNWTESKGACIERAFALWWKKERLHEKDCIRDLELINKNKPRLTIKN